MTEKNPYDRDDDETPQAFEAFATYRDMGPQRSTAKVGQKLGKSKDLMDRWSSDHHWVKRAAAWDAELDRMALAEMRDKHTQMAVDLHRLGEMELHNWLYIMQLRQMEAKATGKAPLPLLKPAELRQLIEAGIKLERLSRGEPDSIQKNIHAGVGDKAIELKHLAGLNTAELVNLAKQAIHSIEGNTDDDAKEEPDDAEQP